MYRSAPYKGLVRVPDMLHPHYLVAKRVSFRPLTTFESRFWFNTGRPAAERPEKR
jgi:hypothetical protein